MTHTGLRFGTSPKSHHVDDVESSPVRTEIFHRLPLGKSTYRLNFLEIAMWPGGRGV